MAAALRAVAVARAAASKVAAGGLRRMSSIFGDLDLKREPDLVPKVEPSTKLYIAGLNKETTPERLREAFSKFGQILEAHVATDRVSGLSRGFGFIQYATLEEAAAGKKGMDCKFLDGWVILADYARPKQPPRVAPENPQSPSPLQGINHSNAMGGYPQSPPLYQSQSSYHAPPSYQSHPYQSPPSNEHDRYTNVAPVNPQAPSSVQDISPISVTAENPQSPLQPPRVAPENPLSPSPFQGINHSNAMGGYPQSPPPYQSQPSYHASPSYQSQPSYHSRPSNEHDRYTNVAPVNPQAPPPVQDISPISVTAENPQSSPPYQSQPSHQHPPPHQSQPSFHSPASNAHYTYNTMGPVNSQNPPSYQDTNLKNAMGGTPSSPYHSQPSYQSSHSVEYNSYNRAAPVKHQSPPSYQPDYSQARAPSYHYSSHGSQVHVNPSQPAYPNQYINYNNVDPINPQSPSFYQHSTRNMVPEGSLPPPSYQHGSDSNQMHENAEAEPSYQYGG